MPVCDNNVEPQLHDGDCCPSCPDDSGSDPRPCTDPLTQEVHRDGAADGIPVTEAVGLVRPAAQRQVGFSVQHVMLQRV